MMTHLWAVPRDTEWIDATLPVAPIAVIAGHARVVYVEDEASIATVAAALQAWGLHVRAERESGQTHPKGLEAETAWETTRPDLPAASRLANILSPVWLPTFEREDYSVPAQGPETWFAAAA